MSTIIKIIKEKTNIPIDSNNINRASMKEIRVDRKNLNMGNSINCVHFSRNQVSWGQAGVKMGSTWKSYVNQSWCRKTKEPHCCAVLTVVEHQGFEPWTLWLRVRCSANWASVPCKMVNYGFIIVLSFNFVNEKFINNIGNYLLFKMFYVII